MLHQILKQLWHNRRTNIWLALELILVTFFIWGVIDPAYVLLSNNAIPQGFNTQRLFGLMFAKGNNFGLQVSDEESATDIDIIMDLVRNYPGVVDVERSQGLLPYSFGAGQGNLIYDSVKIEKTYAYSFKPGDNIFKIMDIRDARTGEILDSSKALPGQAFLSADAANILSPKEDLVGKEIYRDSVRHFTVAGIMQPIKRSSSSEQPTPCIFIAEGGEIKLYSSMLLIVFRIRDDVSPAVFGEQFNSDMKDKLNIGMYRYRQWISFDQQRHQQDVIAGTTNKLRLHFGLAVFFIVCTFLGIAGAFWLRGDERRGEIGVRMAMGSSRRRVLREFLAESWLLSTAAWLIGIFLVMQRVLYNGFAEAPEILNDMYIQNRFLPHFLIVSGIVYVLILGTALLGTYIPARQAANIEPSEALRDDN